MYLSPLFQLESLSLGSSVEVEETAKKSLPLFGRVLTAGTMVFGSRTPHRSSVIPPVTVVIVIIIPILVLRRPLDDFVQLAAVQPNPATPWTKIDFDRLTFDNLKSG